VVAGLYWTGVLKWIVHHLLGRPKSYASAILRLVLPAAIMSSVMTDSTVTALFIKVVKIWAARLHVAASKLLLPLAYASLVGGTLTLLGTAPNLIVSGLYADNTGDRMNVFTITPAALVCFAVFVVTIILFKGLMPNRKSPDDNFENTGEYTAELLVPTMSADVGKTVTEAGLYNVNGGHLIEIIRFDKEVISPVSDDEFIMGGDRLVFSGSVSLINDLKKTHGLAASDHHVFSLQDQGPAPRKLTTATVKHKSHLVGRRMCDTNYEKLNNMVLVAVSRDGERVDESPRNIVLAPGDTLLMECPSAMSLDTLADQLKADLVMLHDEHIIETGAHSLVSVAILVGMILLSTLGVLSVLQSSMLAALCMIVFRCCTGVQAQKSIEWSIVMIFACSVVFGKAIQGNGIADAIVGGITLLCGDSVILTLVILSLTTVVLTNLISNTATAAIFFPIFYQSAVHLGVDPKPFCLALMLCSSMAFSTPIGSPVNTLVYGPGGYKFSDFLKIGIPINLIMMATIIATVYLMYIY